MTGSMRPHNIAMQEMTIFVQPTKRTVEMRWSSVLLIVRTSVDEIPDTLEVSETHLKEC